MECLHVRPGARFDPGLCEGSCPSCGAIVGSESGQPTTIHQGSTGAPARGAASPPSDLPVMQRRPDHLGRAFRM